MLKKMITHISAALLLLLSQSSFAGSGTLFNVAATGTQGTVNISLCLNGRGPLSCQNYNVSALNLSISTAAPNHSYPNVGIFINTPGYTIANLGVACTPISNGYCLFGTSATTPKTIMLQTASPPITTTTLSTSVSNLTLSVTGLTEYGVSGTPSSGSARIITITNTGSKPTVNLAVTQPAWPSGTTSTTNCGSTLAAGSNCTITVTPGNTATSDGTSPCSSGTAPVPGIVKITADNANTVSTNVVVLSYGCIYQGGYAYAFDDTTPTTSSIGGKVAQEADNSGATPSGILWDSSSGCASAPYNSCYTTNADSGSNGTNLSTPAPGGDTYLIFQSLTTTHAISAATYAAGLCTGTFSGYSDWYLPAVCEMGFGANSGGINCGTSGSPTLQNMQSSLVDNGNIGGLTTGGNPSFPGYYWTSAEYSPIPNEFAWYQHLATAGGSTQGSVSKGFYSFGVRCSRALTV